VHCKFWFLMHFVVVSTSKLLACFYKFIDLLILKILKHSLYSISLFWHCSIYVVQPLLDAEKSVRVFVHFNLFMYISKRVLSLLGWYSLWQFHRYKYNKITVNCGAAFVWICIDLHWFLLKGHQKYHLGSLVSWEKACLFGFIQDMFVILFKELACQSMYTELHSSMPGGYYKNTNCMNLGCINNISFSLLLSIGSKRSSVMWH
jgi:hypothetical protein